MVLQLLIDLIPGIRLDFKVDEIFVKSISKALNASVIAIIIARIDLRQSQIGFR